MVYTAFDISKPVSFFFIGEFSFTGTWEHPTSVHQADFELILVEKGTLSLLVNHHPYVATPGTVLLIPPYAEVHGNGKVNQAIDFYWLHFYCHYQVMTSPKDCIDNQVILPTKFSLNNQPDILILLSELMNLETNRKLNRLPLDFLTATVLTKLSVDYQHKQGEITLSPLVEQSLEWVRANISTDLTIQKIATHFEVSNAYLTQQYKHDLHTTPLQHLIRLKIQTAKVLLVQTNLPVYKVSQNSYFKNEKNFMRIFKKQTGLTPLNYRKHFAYRHQNNPFVDPSIPIPREMQEKYHIKYQ